MVILYVQIKKLKSKRNSTKYDNFASILPETATFDKQGDLSYHFTLGLLFEVGVFVSVNSSSLVLVFIKMWIVG